MTIYPFEVPFSEVAADPSQYVTAVRGSLQSEILVMPKGHGFIDYPVFERGYESLKQATSAFRDLSPEAVYPVTLRVPISIVVLRSMMGLTPPEWAHITTEEAEVEVSQGFVRTLDRRVRVSPFVPLKDTGIRATRLRALVETACRLLSEGAPDVDGAMLHRLDKVDTKEGLTTIRMSADIGVPYAVLLYERFLGRPFAGHRDSVSEMVGDVLESAIEKILTDMGISYQKTKRAERIPGFDQAPDFIVPSALNPQVVIEAKITGDDGTARDKVTRIQHLAEESVRGSTNGLPRYEVIACIDGRGFGVRREDMKKMLLATHGKVFTLKTLNRLVDCTRLSEFRSR